MSYAEYIHEKLKKMSLQERVNSQSKQIQLIQRTNYENLIKEENAKREGLTASLERSREIQIIQKINYDQETFKKDVTLHMGSDLGIHILDEKLKSSISNVLDSGNQYVKDRENEKRKSFVMEVTEPKRSFQEKTMMAMYGDDCLE